MRPSNFWIPLRDAARNQGSEQLSAFSRGQRSHHPLSAYMNRHSYTPTLVQTRVASTRSGGGGSQYGASCSATAAPPLRK